MTGNEAKKWVRVSSCSPLPGYELYGLSDFLIAASVELLLKLKKKEKEIRKTGLEFRSSCTAAPCRGEGI